jgi:hypothetical protein
VTRLPVDLIIGGVVPSSELIPSVPAVTGLVTHHR